MGVSVAVTRVAANTSTGTQDITTSDLGGLTPKAVLLIVTRAITDGTAVDGAGWYMGASDGTNEWTQGYEEQHGQATMNSAEEQDTTANRIMTIYDGTATDVVDATANFDSFITNGVRIDWTNAPASAFLITAIFFAGSDLSAHVGTQTLGNTADALIAVTSVGFEADVVITHLLEGTTTLNPGVGLGVVHNNRSGTVTQRSVYHAQRDAFSSSAVGAHYRDGEGLVRLIGSSMNLDYFGTFQTFDSAGFDVQLGNARAPGNAHLGWLALRFGASPVVQSKVYTYSTPTATGSHTDSNPGFTPQFVMYLANRAAAADTSETDADGGVIGVVVTDANETYTNSIASEDAAADSNTQSLSDNQINLPTHTGASGHQATLTSLGATGPVWNYSATDATARLWPGLAIEAGSSGHTVTANQNTETDSAQVVTRQKSKAVAQNTETDTAQGITKQKRATVAQVSETDSAQAIVFISQQTIGQVSESDSAQAIAVAKAKVIGQATETDTVQSITRIKRLTVNQSTESDTAQQITNPGAGQIIVSVNQVTETDEPQSVARIKVYVVSQISETDLAQQLFPQKRIAIAQVFEVDLSQALTHTKGLGVAQVLETDSANAITWRIVRLVHQVIETDVAFAITVFGVVPSVHYVYVIPAENRVYIVPVATEETITDRTFAIPFESRVSEIPHD